MSYPILAVDNEIQIFEREQAEWRKRGIPLIRVENMSEACDRLGRDAYLFVSINADNIHYMPMLPVMRRLSETPIFIITSNFSIRDQVEALHAGADVYAPFQANVEDNIMSALALLHRYGEQRRSAHDHAQVETYRKLLIFPGSHQVFCGDEELPITKTEFSILLYLVANRGIKVTYRQIFRRVWGEGYDEADHNVLWNHVIRLRKKIEKATGGDGYIENIRGIGYRLPAYYGEN